MFIKCVSRIESSKMFNRFISALFFIMREHLFFTYSLPTSSKRFVPSRHNNVFRTVSMALANLDFRHKYLAMGCLENIQVKLESLGRIDSNNDKGLEQRISWEAKAWELNSVARAKAYYKLPYLSIWADGKGKGLAALGGWRVVDGEVWGGGGLRGGQRKKTRA